MHHAVARLRAVRLARSSKRDDHLCTSEVGALCLALAGEQRAAELLETISMCLPTTTLAPINPCHPIWTT